MVYVNSNDNMKNYIADYIPGLKYFSCSEGQTISKEYDEYLKCYERPKVSEDSKSYYSCETNMEVATVTTDHTF